jgi:UDP-perosamine 4-acetyltransferase
MKGSSGLQDSPGRGLQPVYFARLMVNGRKELRRGVVVIGAGGHARVCVELLQSSGTFVAYCISSDPVTECGGVPVLRGDEWLNRLRQSGCIEAFVAIGDNATRARLSEQVLDVGYQLVSAISPAATVSSSAVVGPGVAIMAGSVVNAEATIARGVIVNTGATVDHNCRIGEFAHLAPGCHLAGTVSVGARSCLGVGVGVIPDMTIGDDATIGAGAVVVKDIPSQVIAVGVPARLLSPTVRK